MLTGAKFFCVSINHLEELRICIAPAPRAPHLYFFSHRKPFLRPFDCAGQIRTMLEGAEIFYIDSNHLAE